MNKRDALNNEQKANSEKLVVFFETQQPIHITLNRKTIAGQRYFYNGLITKIHSPTLFNLQDLKTNEIYTFSILELKDGGVSSYTSIESEW